MSERNTRWVTIAIIAITAVLAGSIGILIGLQSSGGAAMEDGATGERQPLYWVAPMDSNYRRDEPGLSPMGMELVPVYAEDASGDGSVRISPAVVQELGVRTGMVMRGDLIPTVDAVAYAAYDEDHLVMVHTRVAGWVESLAVRAEGDPVTAGQVLFQLYSPELVTAQGEFIAALTSGNRGLIDASRQRLAALGLGSDALARVERERRVLQRIPVIAARAGVVTDLAAREGSYLQPMTRAMTIADPAALWFVAEVLERQSAGIVADQRVMLDLPALPGEMLMARVDYVYPTLDARTRSLRVRIRTDAADARVRPNSYARARIQTATLSGVLHLPREAVIRTGDGARVVLADGDGWFHAVPVRLGAEVGDRVVIQSGLQEGQAVVISGQFLIDSESNIDAELLRAGAEDVPVEPQVPAERTATGRGVFLGWHSDGERVRIRHQAIPELEMMAMSMPFRLASPEVAAGVPDGAEMEFDLVQRDGRTRVTAIRVLEAAMPEHQQGGDQP